MTIYLSGYCCANEAHLFCSLPDIIEEIEKEDAEKQKRHLRRAVAKQERLKSRPPRLGKHKYDDFHIRYMTL